MMFRFYVVLEYTLILHVNDEQQLDGCPYWHVIILFIIVDRFKFESAPHYLLPPPLQPWAKPLTPSTGKTV
jgi:hypothetical protein